MSLLIPIVQALVMKFMEEEDRSNLASVCRDIAFESQEEVFSELYLYMFGEPLVAGVRKRFSSRRSQHPRLAYFKALRDVPKKWHFLLMSLHKKDYAKDTFRELMNRWRFPCPHSHSSLTQGKVQLSTHQRKVLNAPHAAFEHAPLLCVAARFSKWGAVRTLLQDYHADPTVTDARGMNVLIMAAWSGKLHIVKFIFEHCREDQLEMMLCAKGIPHMTSACGGKGPFNALTWARRKAAYCMDEQFKKIANLIQQKAENIFMMSCLDLSEETKLMRERRLLCDALAVEDLDKSYRSLLEFLQHEGRDIPPLLELAIADNNRMLRRAEELDKTRL